MTAMIPQELNTYKLRDLLVQMDDPRKHALLAFYDDYKDVFHYAAGSSHNHQAWPGGYADHIADILRINEVTYDALTAFRPLDFTKESAAMALFLHDIEKLFKHGPSDSKKCSLWQKQAQTYAEWEALKWDILNFMEEKYGFQLTEEERKAIHFAHGEGIEYRKDMRVSFPLAAHVHHCDNTSARIYYDDGQGLG